MLLDERDGEVGRAESVRTIKSGRREIKESGQETYAGSVKSLTKPIASSVPSGMVAIVSNYRKVIEMEFVSAKRYLRGDCQLC
jgi:hypothetical protein